jgi:hypothetical protein
LLDWVAKELDLPFESWRIKRINIEERVEGDSERSDFEVIWCEEVAANFQFKELEYVFILLIKLNSRSQISDSSREQKDNQNLNSN